MFSEGFKAVPGLPLEIMIAEIMDQSLRVIEPRGRDRGLASPPPGGTRSEIILGIPGSMTGITLLDKEYSFQVEVSLSNLF